MPRKLAAGDLAPGGTVPRMVDPAELLPLYDDEVRAAEAQGLPDHAIIERDGPVLRVLGLHRGFVSTPRDVGVRGPDLDALIARQRDVFAARDEAVEWKTRAHDEPADLCERLVTAGFVPEEPETVVIALVDDLVDEEQVATPQPDGVVIREVDAPEDMRRIADMEGQVWREDHAWLGDELVGMMAAVPRLTHVFVAEAAQRGDAGDTSPGAQQGDVVSAGWVTFAPGSQFAGLWGGSTLAPWRGRGIYRALVAARARLARDHGVRYLQVDASDDSRPILERLGFVAITTTTPYVWTPPVS
jgi:GNAT superfamily N-acetyltransferase